MESIQTRCSLNMINAEKINDLLAKNMADTISIVINFNVILYGFDPINKTFNMYKEPMNFYTYLSVGNVYVEELTLGDCVIYRGFMSASYLCKHGQFEVRKCNRNWFATKTDDADLLGFGSWLVD